MEKHNGYKHSRLRESIYNLLVSTKTHPTAAWVYEQLKKNHPHVSQGTVYRNLNILADQKRIKMINVNDSFVHFDADMSLHNHVICTKCGKVEDVAITAEPQQESTASMQSGYIIHTHRLDFFGICPDCAAV